MVDATIQTALAAALEAAAKRALRYDPGSRHALAALNDQILAIELTKPAWTFFLIPCAENGLTFQTQFEGDVTTRIKGSPSALASLMNSKRVNLFDSGIEIFGSTHLLIEYQKIFQQLEIDWESALSDVIGDMPGHAAATGLRSAAEWFKGRKQTFDRLLSEYVREELRATPTEPELKNFSQGVDDIRLAADRLEARVAQLKTRFFNSSNNNHS